MEEFIMEKNMSGTKFVWIPRIIVIAFLLFLMLFTFDVFNMNGGVLEKIGGFLLHALPSILIAVFLALGWNRLALCGWVFIGIAAFFTFFFRTYTGAVNFFLISVPPLAAGILFLFARRFGMNSKKNISESTKN